MVWKGTVADPEYWKECPSLAVDFDPPWYHCKTCIENGTADHKARLGIGSKFCAECGTELQWP